DRLVHELEDPIGDHPLDGLDACPSPGIHGSLLGPEGCPFQELRAYATPLYVAGQSAQPSRTPRSVAKLDAVRACPSADAGAAGAAAHAAAASTRGAVGASCSTSPL